MRIIILIMLVMFLAACAQTETISPDKAGNFAYVSAMVVFIVLYLLYDLAYRVLAHVCGICKPEP